VRGCHGGTRDSVDGILAANPGRENVEAWGEDVIAFAKVGEIGALVEESGGTNCDGLLSGSG